VAFSDQCGGIVRADIDVANPSEVRSQELHGRVICRHRVLESDFLAGGKDAVCQGYDILRSGLDHTQGRFKPAGWFNWLLHGGWLGRRLR
jgi:hypothetical protein